MIRKDTDTLISFKFGSLADFYKSVSEKIGSTRLSREHESECKSGEHTSFCGANYSETIQRKHSWPEGVSMLKQLASMEKTITKEWKKVWSEDDGDEMDMERYYNDMPFLQKRIKVLGNRSRNNSIQKILVNPTENANISAKDMLWKTFTAVKVADELESKGTRCEIILKYFSSNIDKRDRNVTFEIPIKEAGEPVNLSLLCTVFSPWFFRYWIFHLFFSHIEGVRGSLGMARKIPTEETENCIVIDSGTALSKEAANNFLKGVKI